MTGASNRFAARPALWIAVLTAVSACSQQPQGSSGGAQAALSPSDQLLLASAKVALPPEGVTPADLPDPQSSGAKYLQTYCMTCHSLPSPAMHSATDWPSVLRRMWLRMGLLESTYRVPEPDLGERVVLLDYLVGNALKVTTATLPDRPGRDEFQKTCSQCHELPDPHQHSSQDWFVVVRRMNDHMGTILGKQLTNAEIETITNYLTGPM
jgi:cytochrome c5